jgi:hypothetical protein
VIQTSSVRDFFLYCQSEAPWDPGCTWLPGTGDPGSTWFLLVPSWWVGCPGRAWAGLRAPRASPPC